MRRKIFPWLGREFVALSGEGKPDLPAEQQGRDLFTRFDRELRGLELSLDNTVRSRLWGRDRESRDQGSIARSSALSGKARSASSSFICPGHFDSDLETLKTSSRAHRFAHSLGRGPSPAIARSM